MDDLSKEQFETISRLTTKQLLALVEARRIFMDNNGWSTFSGNVVEYNLAEFPDHLTLNDVTWALRTFHHFTPGTQGEMEIKSYSNMAGVQVHKNDWRKVHDHVRKTHNLPIYREAGL